MRVLFAAAGTAGHVNPAIAIAQIIKERYPESDFLFLVTPGGMERQLIEKAGYRTATVEVRGIQRKLTRANLRAIRLFFSAGRRVRGIIGEWHPDLIVGTGGYMSYPAVSAGKKAGVPCVLHESNAVPGLAVRLLAKKADLVLGGFRTIGQYLPRKCNFHYVGTPVRSEFQHISRYAARAALEVHDGDFLIVSVGGSLGAQQLNRIVISSFCELSKGRNHYRMILSTGKRFYDEEVEQQKRNGVSPAGLTLVPYIDDMATALTAADLVISRGGAATITELAVAAAPAIIVPYPGATDDHQTKNARALEEIGACVVMPESELTPERLTRAIVALSESPEQLRRMRGKSRDSQPKNRDSALMQCIESVMR